MISLIQSCWIKVLISHTQTHTKKPFWTVVLVLRRTTISGYIVWERKSEDLKHFRMRSIMCVWSSLLPSSRAKFRMQCQHYFFCLSPRTGAHPNLTRRKLFQNELCLLELICLHKMHAILLSLSSNSNPCIVGRHFQNDLIFIWLKCSGTVVRRRTVQEHSRLHSQ